MICSQIMLPWCLMLRAKPFRSDIYPEYKANRSEPPEDLVPQFALVRAATRALSLPLLEAPGFEADDLIATYARLGEDAGLATLIVSSDKDLMQLVRGDVTMLDPMKQRRIGADEVFRAVWCCAGKSD
jgi:DNA polymerase-1